MWSECALDVDESANVNLKRCACKEFDYLISEFDSASRVPSFGVFGSRCTSPFPETLRRPTICATASAFLWACGCAVYLFNLCVSDPVHCTTLCFGHHFHCPLFGPKPCLCLSPPLQQPAVDFYCGLTLIC